MRYLLMIVGLVSHGKALALELTAALAVDPQAIERTVFTYDFDRFDASKILPMWCSICTTESPRVGERYTASLFGTLLSSGTSAFCSGVLLVGSPVFSSAPFDVSVFCADLWYTGTSFLGRGSGSIGAGLSPAPAVLSLAYGTLDTRQRGDLLACC